MGPRGRGGGRGRGGRGGSQRIGGAELAWDPDLGNDKPQPTATYPVSRFSIFSPASRSQRQADGRIHRSSELILQLAIQSSPTATSNPARKEASCPLPGHPQMHTRRPLLHRPGRQCPGWKEGKHCCCKFRPLRGNAYIWPEIHQKAKEATEPELPSLWYEFDYEIVIHRLTYASLTILS